MPTLETAARNAACDAIVDLIDAGSGAGTLVFETSTDDEVATLTFADPAFGNAANGVASLSSAPSDDTNAAGGTVAQASFYDSDSNKILEASVATSGADIDISSTSIGAGDTVSCSSLTVTVPAS